MMLLCLLAAALLVAPAAKNAESRLNAAVARAGTGERAGRGVEWQGRAMAVPGRANAVDPFALAAGWDLLAACLRSGLPVAEALRAVAGSLPVAVADVLRRVSELLALGASPDEAWRPAAACAHTAALAHAARRASRSGSALAGAVGEIAARLRAEQHESAETRARRAAVLMTGPLGLCFLPGFLCLGVVPVVIGLAGHLTVLQ